MHSAAYACSACIARARRAAVAIGVFVTSALRSHRRCAGANKSSGASATASATICRVGIGIDARGRILATEHARATRCRAIACAGTADAVFADAAHRAVAAANGSAACPTGTTRCGRGAATKVSIRHALTARQIAAAIIAATAAIEAVHLRIQFAAVVISGGGLVAVGITQVTRGHARGADARARSGVCPSTGSSASAAIEYIICYDGFAPVIGHRRGRFDTIAESVGACRRALPIRARRAHRIGSRTGKPAAPAIGRRRAQIDFATIGRVVVTIGETHGTGQTTHPVGARGRRIRTAGTRIAAHTAIVDRSDIDLATVGGHHVTVGKPRIA